MDLSFTDWGYHFKYYVYNIFLYHNNFTKLFSLNRSLHIGSNLTRSASSFVLSSFCSYQCLGRELLEQLSFHLFMNYTFSPYYSNYIFILTDTVILVLKIAGTNNVDECGLMKHWIFSRKYLVMPFNVDCNKLFVLFIVSNKKHIFYF